MIYDVAIAGAGVIGAMVARELSRYQLRVCVLEKGNDVACGASKANSGIIHGGFDPEPGTLKAELNVAGVPLLYKAAEELGVPCKNNGSLVVAFGPDQEKTLQMLYARGVKNGVEKMQLLSGSAARALEPQLSKNITAALLVPTAGIICPYELTVAALGNAMDNGAALFLNFNITAVQKDQHFTVTAQNGQTVQAKYFINCAGGGADAVAAAAGEPFFKIIPRAGEYLLLDKTQGSTVAHTVFGVPDENGKGVLVSPTVDGNLLLGPTAHRVPSASCTGTTQNGLNTVQSLAQKSVPGVQLRAVITSFAGVRASVKDGDFIITPSKTVPGLIHAAGIDSPGLTACVAIARRVVTLAQNCGLALKPSPNFNPRRKNPHAFRAMSVEEKDAYIKKHPEYGKIICRCEGVSEGEIKAALRQNPKPQDLDGVKRRTRSGMGRCQGGFCTPYILQLLAKETGQPEEKITKNGPGAEFIVGEL